MDKPTFDSTDRYQPVRLDSGDNSIIDMSTGKVVLGWPYTTCYQWVAREVADKWNREGRPSTD